jgi:hypothetical protein
VFVGIVERDSEGSGLDSALMRHYVTYIAAWDAIVGGRELKAVTWCATLVHGKLR